MAKLGGNMAKLRFLSFAFILVVILIPVILAPGVAVAANYLQEGIEQYRAEHYEEAIELFKKAKQEDPGSSVASFYMGLAYKQKGNLKEAAGHLRDALSLTPPVNDAYVELISVLYGMENLREAREWIDKAEKANINPANVAFLKGLVLAKEGRSKEAIDAFTRAKGLDQSLSQPADLQIATVHAKGNRPEQARKALQAVVAIDPTTRFAAYAKEYEEALRKAIAAYKRWHFTLGLSYQHDDNAVAAPSNQVITCEQLTGGGDCSDSSIVTTFRVDYRSLPGEGWNLNGQYNFYSNTFFEISSMDLMMHSVSLLPVYNFQRGGLTLPLSYSHVWLNEREYMGILAFKPTLNVTLAPGHIGLLSAGYAKQDLKRPVVTAAEDRDAGIYSVGAGYSRVFAEGRGIFNVKYEFTKDEADGSNWDNHAHRINSSLLVPVRKSLNLLASGSSVIQDFENNNSVYGVKRKDRVYSASAGAIWRALKNTDFVFQYTHTSADSNIAVYDYRRNVFSLGVEYSF